jgi:hypothetical protein
LRLRCRSAVCRCGFQAWPPSNSSKVSAQRGASSSRQVARAAIA